MAHHMGIILKAKSLHAFPPMCMDSRNAGGPMRSHCCIHGVRLENLTWENVSKMFALFFSFTLDRCPESIMRMTYLPELSTFPHWRPVRHEPNALDFNAGHAAVFDEPTL